jgi:hypothetical protein
LTDPGGKVNRGKYSIGVCESHSRAVRCVFQVCLAAGADTVAAGSEDTPLVLRWSDFAVADGDGDALALTLTVLPAQGTLQVLRNGAWWTSPTPLGIRASVVASTGSGLSAQAEVSLLDDAESLISSIRSQTMEDTQMFILDLPHTPPTQVSAPASYGTIGICHLSENPADPDDAVNMFSVPITVQNYFIANHKAPPKNVTAKVVRAPAHGTLTSDQAGIFTYHPQTGYLGPDRISILADIGGKELRMEYFVRVMTHVPDDDKEPDVFARGYCPVAAEVWKIGMISDGAGNNTLLVDALTSATQAASTVAASSSIPSLIRIRIADLPGTTLAQTIGSEIVIDKDAAGFGWYVQRDDGDLSAFLPTSSPGTFIARE